MTSLSREALLEKIQELVTANPILTSQMQAEIQQFTETADEQTLTAILRGLVIEDQERAKILHQSAQVLQEFATKIQQENQQIFQKVSKVIEQAEKT